MSALTCLLDQVPDVYNRVLMGILTYYPVRCCETLSYDIRAGRGNQRTAFLVMNLSCRATGVFKIQVEMRLCRLKLCILFRCLTYILFLPLPVHWPLSVHFPRPAERSGEDVDIILARLKNVKAFERFPPILLQQICLCGFYECLEKGITRRSK